LCYFFVSKEIFTATDNMLESGAQDSWEELQEEVSTSYIWYKMWFNMNVYDILLWVKCLLRKTPEQDTML
jgi:hypothetical protein